MGDRVVIPPHRSVHRPRQQDLHAHALVPDFLGERLGQSDHSELRGAVGGVERQPLHARRRGDVDDVSTSPRDHGPQDRPVAQEDTRQVRADHLVPLPKRHLVQAPRPAARSPKRPGGGNEGVDRAEGFQGTGRHRLHVGLAADIESQGERRAWSRPERLDHRERLFEALLVPAHGDDAGTRAGQRQARGPADSARSPGDDHHAAHKTSGRAARHATRPHRFTARNSIQ